MALPKRRPSAASAAKLTVKKHRPLPLLIGLGILSGALVAFLAVMAYQSIYGDAKAERESLKEQVSQLSVDLDKEAAERKRLAAIVNASDSVLKVEQSTTKQLSEQVKNLEAENAKLKSDLSYFERLLPSGGKDEPISIRSLEVAPDTVPNQWRYRALVSQGGREERKFEGSLQVVVNYLQDGKLQTLVLPDGKQESNKTEAKLDGKADAKVEGRADARTDDFKLRFTRFMRVEGQVAIPNGVQLKSFQLRVLERGVLRAQQTVSKS